MYNVENNINLNSLKARLHDTFNFIKLIVSCKRSRQ